MGNHNDLTMFRQNKNEIFLLTKFSYCSGLEYVTRVVGDLYQCMKYVEMLKDTLNSRFKIMLLDSLNIGVTYLPVKSDYDNNNIDLTPSLIKDILEYVL